MVIDINEARARRERRKHEAQFDPSATRDLVEAGIAYFVLLGAVSLSIWILGPSDFKAFLASQIQQQERE